MAQSPYLPTSHHLWGQWKLRVLSSIEVPSPLSQQYGLQARTGLELSFPIISKSPHNFKRYRWLFLIMPSQKWASLKGLRGHKVLTPMPHVYSKLHTPNLVMVQFSSHWACVGNQEGKRLTQAGECLQSGQWSLWEEWHCTSKLQGYGVHRQNKEMIW